MGAFLVLGMILTSLTGPGARAPDVLRWQGGRDCTGENADTDEVEHDR
jgi:hypothetical protein